MEIQKLLSHYAKQPQLKALAKALENKRIKTVGIDGLAGSSCPLVFASIANKIEIPIVFILRDADEAGYFYHDLMQLGAPALFFPSSYKRAVKYGQRDAANEILRTEVLSALSSFGKTKDGLPNENDSDDDSGSLPTGEGGRRGSSLFIVTHPSALAEMAVDKTILDDRTIHLSVGQRIDITDVQHQLRDLGFRMQDYVYEPGQFAVRGSILDVYSFSNDLPFRLDFFGDEIETIRTFQIENQLSADRRKEIDIVPELAAFSEKKVPLTEFLPEGSLLVSHDMGFVVDVVGKTFDEGFSSQALNDRMAGATEQEQDEIRREMNAQTNLCPASRFNQSIAKFKQINIKETSAQKDDKDVFDASFHFFMSAQPLIHKNFDLLSQTFEDYILQNFKIYILSDSHKQVERIKSIVTAPVAESQRVRVDAEAIGEISKTLHEGFVDNDLGLCLFTDHQIFERFHKYNLRTQSARAGKMALTMKELQEMEPGDFIVHVDYGIGKFVGLVRVPVGDTFKEVIRIVYQGNDKVDVSIHSLYKISKYKRSDTGEPPRLSTLGTGAWDRLKEKAKKRIKDIARDLIKLYAKRRHEIGFAFSPDSYLQHELEGSFLYEDTPDQMKATAEVKADMESKRPMDRLVCGDVGFGKTEVAVRAAFKAACDSKQVAVLVPTTVLAFQHYQTFRDRMANLPVRVDYLTRARSAKHTKQILADLADGKIDILVGTHKLIGKSVKWKDIGLLIIDEEQKFGVSTKEKLRQLKTNIDTLTMSATPIPRTLQFSLMGARDMSIMRTPPPNRYPIQTEVTTFSVETIIDAINFEMSRNGQVYFVNDRISNLEELGRLIEKHIPDCRVAIGHGRMTPENLEKIVMGFMNHDYDVLLSTTIVENGIDVPNANTIIINDAHRFGLSDLHQMRGRVGRSNRKAFCYLMAPPLSYLPTESRRRLEALETFSDLGSGFNLAMQDLDIRGAGNLLGAEQSGFMEDLGYETYQKILSQAVSELKNDEFQNLYADQMAEGEHLSGEDFVDDCNIESDLEMYFPDTYVPGSSERMLLYRELDKIETDDDLNAYRQRLEDRFGPVPAEGEELLQVVMLRRLGRSLGCEKIILKQHLMQMQFVSRQDSVFYKSEVFGKILNYVGYHPRVCDLKVVGGKNRLAIKMIDSVSSAVKVLRKMKNP
jgi:transcription-repair coupling factor (superfamily II helicase)